jgi:hypothetical protein
VASVTDGDGRSHAHLAFAPLGGGHWEVDRDGEIELDVDLLGQHVPYFPPPDETANPFLGPGSGEGSWQILTLGTPVRYRIDGHEGEGTLFTERSRSRRQAYGFTYLMAVSAAATVVLTCGQPDETTEVWAGRILTAGHDLTFLPLDSRVTAELGPGRADVTLARDDVTVRVTSQAPLDSFYDSVTPSQTIFGAPNPVAKTMQAALRLEVGDEVVELPQSILELGGVRYPS